MFRNTSWPAIAASLTLFVTGCGVLPGTTPLSQIEKKSSYVPAGSALEMTGEMTIPRGRASLHFQEGQLDMSGAMLADLPYCELFVRIPQVTERVINPGVVFIDKVNDTSREVPSRPSLYGSVSKAYTQYQTDMQMAPQDESGLRSLRCVVRRYDDDRKRYLTIGEIQQALGDNIILQPPGRYEE